MLPLYSVLSKALEFVVNYEHSDANISDPWINKMLLINLFSYLNFPTSIALMKDSEFIRSYGGFNKIGFSIEGPPEYPNSIFLLLREFAKIEGINFIDLDLKYFTHVMRMYTEYYSLFNGPEDRIIAASRDFTVLGYSIFVEIIFEELVNYLEKNNPNKDKKYLIVIRNFHFKNLHIAYTLKKLTRSLNMKIAFAEINVNGDAHLEEMDNLLNKALDQRRRMRGVVEKEPYFQSSVKMAESIRNNLFGCDPLDLTPSSINPLYKEKWKELERTTSKEMIFYENIRLLKSYMNIISIELIGNDMLLKDKLSTRSLKWREIRSIIRNAVKLNLLEENKTNIAESKPTLHVSYIIRTIELMAKVEPKKHKPKEDIDLTEVEQRAMKNFVEPDWIETSFDDIGSLKHAKEEIQSLLIPLRMKAFQQTSLIKSPSGILLYGPPGTGKTMLARALAKTANAFFIHVSASSIISKWFGESEDNVAAIFSLAKKRSPSIIFIDEVDGLLQMRDISDHENSRRVKNEFFSSWDGLLSGSNNDVTVIAATNRPFDLDAAALRRLPHKVLIPLPDRNARKEIFQKILKNVDITLEFEEDKVITEEERDQVFEKLADMTENYSGSDIKSVCVRAALQLVRDFMKTEEYNTMIKDENKINDLESIATKYAIRPISLKEFTIAIKEISPSVDPKSPTQIEMMKWHQTYGHKSEKKKVLTTIGF